MRNEEIKSNIFAVKILINEFANFSWLPKRIQIWILLKIGLKNCEIRDPNNKFQKFKCIIRKSETYEKKQRRSEPLRVHRNDSNYKTTLDLPKHGNARENQRSDPDAKNRSLVVIEIFLIFILLFFLIFTSRQVLKANSISSLRRCVSSSSDKIASVSIFS